MLIQDLWLLFKRSVYFLRDCSTCDFTDKIEIVFRIQTHKNELKSISRTMLIESENEVVLKLILHEVVNRHEVDLSYLNVNVFEEHVSSNTILC